MKNTMITPSWKEQRYGWVYFALQLLVLPTAVVLLLNLLPFPLTEAQQNVVFFVLNFFCVALVFFRYLKASLKRLAENLSPCLGTAAAGFGLYYLGQILVGLAITWFYPNFRNVNDMTIQVMVRQTFLPMAISTIFLVPVAEEVLYRGLVFGSLAEKDKRFAYVVSTLVFCAIHVAGYVGVYPLGLLALCFCQYLPAGIFLAWAYHRSGTICTSMLIHMAVNAIGILAMR